MTTPSILLVDDEPEILDLLQDSLEPIGYRILRANNGQGGLKILESEPVDLVLSDMRMPGMTGAQLLERVAERWPDVVRMLVTGYTDVSSAVEAINRGGIQAYIEKPWDPDVLVRTISEAVEEKLRRDAEVRQVADDLELAERQRERAEQVFLAITTTTEDAVVTVDDQARVTYWNQGAANMFGYPSSEAIGRDLHGLIAPERFHADFRKGFGQYQTSGRGNVVGQTVEIVAQRSDGTEFPVELSISALRSGEGWHSIGIVRDITDNLRRRNELIEARETAEAAARAKGEFLASMSHEIRTPMNGVLGMAQLLRDTSLDDEQREYTEIILNSGQALLTIINDILDFSKIDAGKLELSPVDFDLERAAHEVCRLLAVRAAQKGLELIVDYTPSTPRRFTGDAGRIRQVLLNLVGNAIKFTASGHVRIGVSAQPVDSRRAALRIEVEDTGIGIDPDARESLFEAFTQADASTTRRYGGTGLGLSISERLVQLMAGRIGVDSTPGVGSTFWLELTLELASPTERLPDYALNGVRTLLVDDNPINRRILDRQLRGFDMRVESVASGKQAIETLHAAIRDDRGYALGILDHMIPGMDGEQLARAIRADPQLADLPLVLLTSGGQRGDAAYFEAAGFDAYLVKPVAAEVLGRSLSAVLGAHAQSASLPMITRHLVRESTSESQTDTPRLRGRVLLAEDNPVNRKVAESMLRKLGLEVTSAADGREAIRRWVDGVFNLILMDCQMPVMDGYTAARRIREQEVEGTHIPIVALTANAMETDRKKSLAAGMDDHVAKPFTQSCLLASLQRWLGGAVDAAAVHAEALDGPQPTPSDAGDPNPMSSIDPTVLDTRREAMSETFAELIPVFLDSTRELLDELPRAHAGGDLKTAHRLAHNLKSSSANLGAMSLSALGAEMELQIKEARLTDPESQLEAMRQEFERVREALQGWGDEKDGGSGVGGW